MARYGFGGVNSTLNTKNDFGIKNSFNQDNILSVGRVINVILEGDDYKSIGNIEFVGIESTPGDISSVNPQNNLTTAKPLFPNSKNYPLVNEIVLIFRLPDVGIKSSTASKSLYYLSILSMWNHPHHNALPYYEGNLQPTQQKSYVQTELGSPKITTNQPTEIYFGQTFKEKDTINPLLPFEGDVIHEGRWGNSMRFGSTVQNKPNNWSTTGNNGDPILILRNGQGPNEGNGYKYITEDINTDLGSIYFGSTQQIPLEAASTSYTSYKNNPPTTPNQYIKNQVIINSGRLVFNSTNDHILLSSNKSINLNSQNGLNVDTNTAVFQTKNIYLGDKNATEPLLLGNKTFTLLKELIVNLKSFMQIASSQVSTPPGTPLGPLNMAASQMQLILENLDADLSSKEGDIRSKNNFTT
jgi:hypothetical protein